MDVRDTVLAAIGNTPLIKLRRASEETGCTILGKAEFMNPGHSVKDRAALGIVTDAMNKGLLGPGGLIVEGTAGNTGIGLTIVGNALDNRIIGHDNDETLAGEAGNDRLIGNGGSDTLFGSWGADRLSGGAGVDGFFYEEIGDSSLTLGYDTITDFEAGVDWIDLLEIDADTTKDGLQAFNTNGTSTHTPGDLWITPYGAAGSANYMLYGDVNGDGHPDFQIRIHLASGSIDQINIVY